MTDLSILKNLAAHSLLPIIITSTIFFFAVFSIFLGGRKLKPSDTEARIRDIVSDGPALSNLESKKKKKRIFSRLKSDKIKKRTRQLEDELYNVGIELPATDFLIYWITCMALLCVGLIIAQVDTLITILIVLIVAFLPAILVSSRKKKRCAIIESQLVECIQILCNALKAGHSFTQAIHNISTEMDGPISEEFGRVFLEIQHGMSLDDSLDSMCARVGSDDLGMMCTAVEIQRQVGGNLSQILLNISGTIKARIKLKSEIKVKSASGRISGLIIGALPIGLFLMFLIINPDYMAFFTNGIAGYACILVCLVLEAIGFIVINKIITIKY